MEQNHTPGPWKEWENTKPTAEDKQRIQQKASELYDQWREWAEWEACQNGAEYEHRYQRQQVNKQIADLTANNEKLKQALSYYEPEELTEGEREQEIANVAKMEEENKAYHKLIMRFINESKDVKAAPFHYLELMRESFQSLLSKFPEAPNTT